MEKNNLAKRDFEEEVISNNLVRRYHIHLPPNYDVSSAFPLLIALHGRLGTGKKMIKQTDFNRIADREGFIVVYPEGFKRGWADGRGITHADKRGVDDVAFIDKLIEVLQGKLSINHTRIYVAGHSNGGFMAQRLAIERSHKFAAVAVVAASLSEWLASRFTPSRSMPVSFINSTADTVTPYEGGRQPGGAQVLSVEDTVKIWVRFNGCKEAPEVQDVHGLNNGPLVSVFTYGSCKNHSQVKLYKIKDGGHVWPGESEDLSSSAPPLTAEAASLIEKETPALRSQIRGVGKLSAGIDASEEIWKFFSSTAQAISSGIQANSGRD
jgi:polyhydroxybutyrate depolymerase